MSERRSRGELLAAILLVAMTAAVGLLAGGKKSNWQGAVSALIPSPSSVAAAERNPWRLAAQKVTEDRGEAMGRQAQVAVPSQLRHYSDRRRFLAIQVAEWHEHEVDTPRDYAGLADLIRRGELVEVAPVTDSYVLYGVGALADAEPFTYYDKAARRSVPILNDAELAQEQARLTEATAALKSDADALRREMDALGKRERAQRTALRVQLAKKDSALKATHEQSALLDSYYKAGERRSALDAERAELVALAGDFAGRAYDLNDPSARKEMKVRMLSHLRPAARAIMQELANSYYEKFQRPLPVTSLVRPDEYQRQLGKTNANATRINTPPHSTGLAFDILYRYMTAEEQEYVMAAIARLRDAGRVESLRENRDHFHVFAFIDGQRHGEEVIRASLGEPVTPTLQAKTSTHRRTDEQKPKHVTRKSGRKEASSRVGKPLRRK